MFLFLFPKHLSGKDVCSFSSILRTYSSGKVTLLDLTYVFIFDQVGQQEPDKESVASVDEVARQLERQALEEKERDDDDEGKWLI